MTARNTWKKNDIEVAKDHHMKRTAYSGGNSGGTRGDVVHPLLYIECKYSQKRLPPIEKLMDDTIEKSSKEKIPDKKHSKIPIVVVTKGQGKGTPRKRFVIMRYDDYLTAMKEEFKFGLEEADTSDFPEYEE